MEDRASVLREMRICRFCLTENEPLSNIYEKDKKNSIPLPLQIMACVALEVFANDGMPQLICKECRTQTLQSYTFKTVCKRSDDALKLYLATGILRKEQQEIQVAVSVKRPAESTETYSEEKRAKNSIVAEVVSEDVKSVLEISNDQLADVPADAEEAIVTNEGIDSQKVNFKTDIVISEQVSGQTEEVLEEYYAPEVEHQEEQLIEAPKVSQVITHCFPCKQCERSFPLQQLLDIHMRQHTRERKFCCEECNKKFFSKHDLTKHIQTHTGAKPFSCIICDKSFSRATLLHRHEKIHVTVPKYLCTYCDKTYLASEDLDAHMLTHKKKRPFKCNHCDKSFAFKQGLERHEVVHTGESPHKCNYCNEGFTTPSKLARHITSHAGARPYPCKLCPRTFLLSHHLSRHLRNHYNGKATNNDIGEYKCDVCSMSFKRRFCLINHSAIHSMVNLKCVICNKEFEDAQTVKEHVTTHLSGLPFPCDKCDYSFENQDDLEDHEMKHADNESDEEYYPPSAQDSSESLSQPVEESNVQDTTESPVRRSQRGKKVKNYADFLKVEDFSESDEENQEETEEEYIPPTKVSTGTIQPVIRSDTVKVYKGVKDKSNKLTECINPFSMSTATKSIEQVQNIDSISKDHRTVTKITTLENLGLSKSALDAMTEKSGFVEMKIGQKVIRVQKLMMTKADVQAMASQGKVEMKGTKVVVKNSDTGIVDLNKLTAMGKSSPTVNKDELKEESQIEIPTSNSKSLRTYIKKFVKKDDHATDVLENEASKDIVVSENVMIDLSTNDEEGETSINESEILAPF